MAGKNTTRGGQPAFPIVMKFVLPPSWNDLLADLLTCGTNVSLAELEAKSKEVGERAEFVASAVHKRLGLLMT